jgi:hypothetical protein
MKSRFYVIIVAALAALMSSAVHAQDKVTTDAGRHFPDRPLWGDQHLHTSWSPDAVVSVELY